MGRIYYNLKEIPIPPEGRLNSWDMKVSVYRKEGGQRRRTIIGAATSKTMMIPNENFRSAICQRRHGLCDVQHPRTQQYGAALSRRDAGPDALFKKAFQRLLVL